jgi:monoamine oxidase
MMRLTRRHFVLGGTAMAAAPALAQVSPPAVQQQPLAPSASTGHAEVDVIIVGAGAAGIAAARRLSASGYSFTLVEASDRIGGRCFTETRSFGVPFDRGAHLIHVPEINPLIKLAPRTGLDIYRAPSGQRVRIGRRDARESELENFLAALVRAHRSIAEAGRGSSDIDCAQAMPGDLGGWRSTIEFALGPYGVARDLKGLSAADFGASIERDFGAYCRQGYGALLAKLAEGIPVELATPVTHIDTQTRGSRVDATTSRGTLSGRYVIVTASTAVLASERIKFDRGLPKRQLDALHSLKLGSFDHIVLDMPGNPLGLQRDDLVFEKSSGPRTAALLANISGTSLSQIEVGGGFGRELAAQGEKAMADFAAEWLAGLFGSGVKAAIRRTQATRWNAEPWALGAVSGAVPGGHWARKALMEPVRGRVYFAGEAMHESMWGTVGGAWESGERAAAAVIRRLSGAPDPQPNKPDPAPRPARRRKKRRR